MRERSASGGRLEQGHTRDCGYRPVDTVEMRYHQLLHVEKFVSQMWDDDKNSNDDEKR
jgi:hypothetical protein